MTRLQLVVLMLLVAVPAAAKPLYVTVPRSYSTTEPAVVDVAFAGHAPVELRVLKSKDLDRYIREQANLRRAYTEPPTIVNPGRYLARGLNAVENPGSFLLDAMDPELRRALAPSLPERRRGDSRRLSRLAEGPQKLIGIPDGMELVRSEWLNLDLGGADRGFDVPGFDAWSASRSGFQERRVALRPLPAGVYVLQMVQEQVEGQVTLVVSDLTVQLKQSDGQILARVAGRDQRPRQGVEVTVHLGAGNGPRGKTDAKGEVRLGVDEPRLLVTATQDGDTAVVDTDFYSTLAVAPDVFIYSDRPIYKPGDDIRFRGLVRKPASFLAQLFEPKRRAVTVRLKTREGGELSTRARIDELGSFSGELSVPEELSTGVVQLVAELDDREYQSEARVQAYVKPTFYVELDGVPDSAGPGDTITATLRARRYAGGVPDGTRYEVFLYRSVLTTPAWVDDAGMGGQGSAVTYGSVSTTEGQLSVPLRLYSTIEERANSGSDFDAYDPWSSAAELDAEGEARITVTIPPLTEEDKEARTPFKYTLTVRAQDPEASTASVSRQIFFGDCDVRGVLRPSSSFVTVGGEASLAVRAITLAGRPFGAAAGEVSYVLRGPDGDESALATKRFDTGAESVWRDRMPADRAGTVLARVTLTDKQGRAWSGETKILVIGTQGEPVVRVPILTLEALPAPLEPGQRARLIALFPNRWGPGGREQGPVWITLSGAQIYATELVQASGTSLVYEFPVERRFGSAVYASVAYATASGRWDERTVAFRIIPRERTLTVRVEPEQAEAAPLGNQTLRLQVTDHNGQGVAAQVSVGVVDKAIYALQTELRPRVLDFFYPLVRNNVMSFYSTEFQGYGYGEYLARLCERFRAREFAAVKPPEIKRKDEDTAYWTPGVLTNASGEATVTFRLPANQTLWVVTAVAADDKGRFGEGTAEFASRGGMLLATSLPQFLRQGDRAQATVRVASSKDDEALELDLHAEAGGSLMAAALDEKVRLAAKSERVLPVTLTAGEVGTGSLSLTVKSAGDVRQDRRELRVRPAAVRERIAVSALGGGELQLELPDGALVESVELALVPTSVGAALTAVRELLDYPYGCLEQLVATTIPNVAVYRTLQEVDALGKLDPEAQALLEEAYSRSVLGVQRILALAVKSGGFTWFGGYSAPSLPLTLIALDGLTYAAEADLVKRQDPRLLAAARYLTAQGELPPVLDATRTYVLARLEGKAQAPQARALLDRVSPEDMYSTALAVLAAEHAGILEEEAAKTRAASLIQETARNVARTADYRLDDAFWRYPIGRVGLTAIISHAASRGGELDRDQARTRFVQALAGAQQLSTFDRSTLLLHNLWLIAEDAKTMQQMQPPAVDVSGGGRAAFAPRGAGLVAALDRGVRQVEVGKIDGIASLSARVLVPLSAVEPREQGMSLRRSYWLLRPDGREKLDPNMPVAQGQYVLVELTLDAHEADWRRDRRSGYYVVEDALPAGFEPVIEDKRFRSPPYELPLAHEALKFRSLDPERARFFFEEPTWWSRSPRSIGYVMRAQFPGTFSVPPAKVADMYAPSVMAQTGADTLAVRAPK